MAKIEWKGGECPVSGNTLVKVYRKDGGDWTNSARGCIWEHEGDSCDIIAYEVIEESKEDKPDNINHPSHYVSHPSGIECIQITEHLNFCIGNAIKYLWRSDLKHDAIEDLSKAKWYIEREIARRKALESIK